MTGNTIPVGKFSGEVCKKGSRTWLLSLQSTPRPRGTAGPCHLAAARSSRAPFAAAPAPGGGGSLAAAGRPWGGGQAL